MAPHSSTLAWKIPWMEEPGGLRSMGSRRVRHDWTTLLSLFTFMHWRKKWKLIPVFLPGESQGWGSLVGCHLWGHTESDNWRDLAAAAAGLVCLELIGCKFGLIVSQNTSYWRRQSVKWIRRKRQVIIKVVLNNKILYNRKFMDKRNFPNEKLPLDRNSWG